MKSLKIGYAVYEIISKESDDSLIADGNECLGMADLDNRKIYINSKFDRDQNSETLVHEVLHCIDNFMGTGLTEEQVKGLGKGIYLFLKDNDLWNGVNN